MRCASAWLLLLPILLGSAASALTQGQQDDFTSGADGWARGDPALGGPGGASDGYLELASVGGLGQNGRLVTFNRLQWSGDYLAAGVEAIGVFLDNLGATDLEIRLAFGDNDAPLLGETWYATTEGVVLPAGSGWVLVVFPIGSADLQRAQGTATYAELMSNVATLRILHVDDAAGHRRSDPRDARRRPHRRAARARRERAVRERAGRARVVRPRAGAARASLIRPPLRRARRPGARARAARCPRAGAPARAASRAAPPRASRRGSPRGGRAARRATGSAHQPRPRLAPRAQRGADHQQRRRRVRRPARRLNQSSAVSPSPSAP